jgi:phosphatidylglycerophosphatase A
MNPKADPPSAPAPPARTPRLSILIATVFGLGYLPKAPGTWGSLAGLALFWAGHARVWGYPFEYVHTTSWVWDAGLVVGLVVTLFLAILGVWTSGRVATYVGKKDPQFVAIDEVSGQHLTYVVALAPLNWKYLLLGFILFRVFDIWKPFPARHAERLPGGWGIMADDWVAAIYAALGLWLARALGL